MIWRRKYHAPCCCVFKIVVLCVKRRCVLYCSRARMRLRSPLCNYSVEAFHNDVPGCVGKKTSRKTREIHSFSMTFSSDDFLCLEGYFQKKVHPNPWSYLIVIKICLRFMFHNLVYHDTPRIWWTHIWLWPCLTVKGPFYGIHLYSPTLQTQRCSPSWSENVCTGTDSLYAPIASIICLKSTCQKPRNYQQLASSVQFENQLASSMYSVGFILPGSRSTVGFITRDFHVLISRQHSQTNRRGLYTLFLTSKSRCVQKISSVDALLTTQNVLSWSGRFGGGHTGWSQLQLASSVSPLWIHLGQRWLNWSWLIVPAWQHQAIIWNNVHV